MNGARCGVCGGEGKFRMALPPNEQWATCSVCHGSGVIACSVPVDPELAMLREENDRLREERDQLKLAMRRAGRNPVEYEK